MLNLLIPTLERDEMYAGLVKDRETPHGFRHLILLPDKPPVELLTWEQALAWAASLGKNASLPNRREQALLYANCKEEFHQAWYWSGEQYAADPVCAWVQVFGFGGQGYDHKSLEYRARAVRSEPAIFIG